MSAKKTFCLSDILRDFKKFTFNQIIKAISENEKESLKNWLLWIVKEAGKRNQRNENYQFGVQDIYPIECAVKEILDSRPKYVHQNPV